MHRLRLRVRVRVRLGGLVGIESRKHEHELPARLTAIEVHFECAPPLCGERAIEKTLELAVGGALPRATVTD
jgi:hypothetical protein